MDLYKDNRGETTKWRVRPSYIIGLHKKDLVLLTRIRDFFGVGTISTGEPNKDTVRYIIRKLEDITAVVIPHFDKYPLLSHKRADFLLFKAAV
jgi:hypothetical protein